MNRQRHSLGTRLRILLTVLPAGILMVAGLPFPKLAAAQAPSAAPASAPIPPDQLDSLVAPIALYPDPLLAQTLAAATYPLEIIQLQQWLAKNPGLKDQALADAVAKEPWDPSVQALAGLPDVVKRLADDIQWTTDLGNAFLAQEQDVMNAVQRMRAKAQANGHLSSNEQVVVKTEVVETKQVIVVQPANPQVVYVPVYSPVVVYGPPVYPYPPIYYPPYYPGTVAIAFGVGVAMGYWWRGGYGWSCGWGGNSYVTINNNNTWIRNDYNRNINRGDINRGDRGGNAGNRWQHRPEHRGGTPYRDRTTADRFGGTTRSDSLANRQAGAREQLGRQGGNVADRSAGLGSRTPGAGAGASAGNRMAGAGTGNRPGAPGIADRTAGAGGANRPASPGAGNRPAGGGGDRIGNRTLPSSGAAGGNRNAFGSSQGFNGARANAASNRGAASMAGGPRAGGGAQRAGGGRR